MSEQVKPLGENKPERTTENSRLSESPPVTYPLDVADQMRIKNDFTYHPPKPGQMERYEALRHRARMLAEMIHFFCPPSRERSLALTKLEEVVMWANAAIARNE